MSWGIEDYGLFSSIGSGKTETAGNLFSSSRSGLSPIQLPNGKNTYAGIIQKDLDQYPEILQDLKSRNNQLAYSIFKQIEPTFNQVKKSIQNNKIGIVIGTSTSGISDVENAFKAKHETGKFPDEYHYKMHEMGSPAEFLARLTGCEGPAYTVSCACSSGSKAMASAARLLEAGICDLVITGGVDTLCNLTLLGFNSLEVISESPSLPFSKNRDGINIGEAGALFLMTRNKCENKLLGYGESSDAYHHSAPHPEGEGAMASMKSALSSAKLSESEIDYINLHGTGTLQNDSMEAKAVYEIFGTGIPCSSTKSLTGHTLGAAGAIEAAFSLLALEHQQLPVHHWDNFPDTSIPQLNLISDSRPEKPVKTVLSNSYAFGGNNCSIILGRNKG